MGTVETPVRTQACARKPKEEWMTPEELHQIENLATSKRWPTMHEIGQLRQGNLQLVAEVKRLQKQLDEATRQPGSASSTEPKIWSHLEW